MGTDKDKLKRLADMVVDNVAMTSKEVLTSSEAARYLGISQSYLYKLAMRKQMPHYKPIGKMCYFNRHELEGWLQYNRIGTAGAEVLHEEQKDDMILTDYYKFVKLDGQKSKMRIDCIASTRSYDMLERYRDKKGQIKLYIGDNTYTKAGQSGRSDLSLSYKDHISSIFAPDIKLPYWYGDFHRTADAALFVCHDFAISDNAIRPGSVVEIFVARGQRHNRHGLFNMLCDGDLSDEVEALRKRAVTESATGSNV